MKKYLFLDRDGVINVENMNGYILSTQAFQFYDGVLEAMKIFANAFDKICIVTNQRCIGKGLLTRNELTQIHDYMQAAVHAAGGRIDFIAYAPALQSDDWYRKPNIGMANLAQIMHPSIQFEKSTMVGNNLSDMEFGKRVGMETVLLHTTASPITMPHPWIDHQYESLIALAQNL